MRIKIIIPKNNKNLPEELSFDADLKSKKDLPDFLREVAKILESPRIQDVEIF